MCKIIINVGISCPRPLLYNLCLSANRNPNRNKTLYDDRVMTIMMIVPFLMMLLKWCLNVRVFLCCVA